MGKKQKQQLALFVAVTLAFVLLAVSIGLTQGGQAVADPNAAPVEGVAEHDRR